MGIFLTTLSQRVELVGELNLKRANCRDFLENIVRCFVAFLYILSTRISVTAENLAK